MSNTFVFDLCDASEIYLLINQLSVDKASGPNGFPTKILQMISREISSPLNKICNIAVTTGPHTNRIKIVNALPIFKKGSRLMIPSI